MLHRRLYSKLIQMVGNLPNAHAVLVKRENLPDSLPRFLIYDEPVFILRVFPVPIGRIGANIFPLATLHVKVCPYFYRNVLAVTVIDEIFEGNKERMGLRVFGQGIVAVIDGDEAHPKHGKHLFQIPSPLNIVARETGKILAQHGIDLPLAQGILHLMEGRSFKIHSAVAIVHKGLHQFQVAVLRDVLLAKCLLAGNAVALGLITVILGQPRINGCPINRFGFGHRKSLRSSDR